MTASRLLRTILCVYECIRLAFLVGAFVLLQPEGAIAFPWLALITPGAMFLLMALFWRLNMSRYRVYGPLYLAGKGLSVTTALLWLFFVKGYMIREMLLFETAFFIVPGIVFFLILGDMLSVWLVSKMMRST
ncbi:MAG: hypothetical protein LBC52_03740 [Treponema sp.]|jgi:hypothetical protein|nr:hypothetical protein [Treponema sp.]